ncbi:MAG: metal ABC transporter permease [Phycisphaerales bacterium]|nr:metal ABC transporter permease [Phycisphaerales bacterium]
MTPASITDVTDRWPGWGQVLDTLTLQAGFNTTVVIVGTTLLGIAAGVIGAFALLRKRALMADALSHATLPGVCLAFLVLGAFGVAARSLPLLLLGAAATGVLGLLCIHLLLRHTRLREDAAIGIVLSVFFGAGVVLLSVIQSRPTGNQGGLSHFIYGQTAAMSRGDAAFMATIAALAVLAALLLAKEFAVVCFDDGFAAVAGLPVVAIDLVLMTLVVLVTVTGLQAVGLLLVVALLVIPAAAARFWTERLWLLLVLAAAIGGLSGYLGASMSALLPRKPAGAVIVLTAGAVFACSMLAAPNRGVLAAAIRILRTRLRVASEHLLEVLYERERLAPAGGAVDIRRIAVARGWPGWRANLVAMLLSRRGLVERRGRGLALTGLGRAAGARVSRNHRLWEQYLVTHAEIAPSHVDWSADQVEHVLSEPLVRELEAALRAQGIDVPAARGGMEGATA